MKQVTLKGQNRTVGNKQAIKVIRRAGNVPCNVYGNGVESKLFTISAKDLKTLTHTPNAYIVELDIEGAKQLAVLREVQYHPLTDEALHADFLAVDPAKAVTIDVPVVVSGLAEGVKLGGKLLVSARKLKVSAKLDKLPDTLNVDCSPLGIGKQIVAGDLNFDGVTILSPKATIICSVRSTRAAVEGASAEGENA